MINIVTENVRQPMADDVKKALECTGVGEQCRRCMYNTIFGCDTEGVRTDAAMWIGQLLRVIHDRDWRIVELEDEIDELKEERDEHMA